MQARLTNISNNAILQLMAKKNNPVEDAVEKVGGATRASNICGVSNQTVYDWIEARCVGKLVHAIKLANAAGIDVEELAGDGNP